MADSLRQKIVDALLAQLRTITVANGYETNLGRKVFEWRDLERSPWTATDLGTESDNSALNVKDKSEPAEDATVQGRHDKDLQFELELATSKKVAGSADATPTAAHQVRKLIADIEKSLANHTTWITTLNVASISAVSVNDMDVVQEGTVLGGAKLQFSVRYSNKRFNPYSQ